MKAIVVGRHSGEIPDVETVERRDIQFPATKLECLQYLEALLEAAQRERAALIFQVLPGQAWAALHTILHKRFDWVNHPEEDFPRVGVVINVPGERPAGVVREFWFDDGYSPRTAEEAVQFANPRTQTEQLQTSGGLWLGLRIRVDPPMRFEFSHIEWLS